MDTQFDPGRDAYGGSIRFVRGRMEREGEEGTLGEGEGTGIGGVEYAGAGGDLLTDCESGAHGYCNIIYSTEKDGGYG